MRESTIRKIFGYHWDTEAAGLPFGVLKSTQPLARDTTGDEFTMLMVNGRLCIVHEFFNESDGFEVYVGTPGNSIEAVRMALNITIDEGATS